MKWRYRFLELADHVAQWSKDPSTKVGCVIADEGGKVVGLGYNGFPICIRDDERLNDRSQKYDLIIHAEMNAILNATRSVEGCGLYVPFPPCIRCAVHIIQVGISEVTCYEPTADILERWGADFEKTRQVFREAEVQYMELPRL